MADDKLNNKNLSNIQTVEKMFLNGLYENEFDLNKAKKDILYKILKDKWIAEQEKENQIAQKENRNAKKVFTNDFLKLIDYLKENEKNWGVIAINQFIVNKQGLPDELWISLAYTKFYDDQLEVYASFLKELKNAI